MNIKKNDILTVEITDTGTEGEGIGKNAGFTLFVKDAVIGDTVQVKVMKAKKNYAYAKLEKVLVPSPFRVQPPCAFHRQCGGCQLQSLSYEKQLEFKQNKIRTTWCGSAVLIRKKSTPVWSRLLEWRIPGITGIRPSFPSGMIRKETW